MNITKSYVEESFYCKAGETRSALPENVGAYQVSGNCMEGSGIYDGDIIIVDFGRAPRIGDPCLCEIDGRFKLKKLLQVHPSGLFTVGTNYNRERLFEEGPDGEIFMNSAYFADKVHHAAVIGCADSHRHIRWLNDFRDYPEEFPVPVAMHGDIKDVRKI